MQDNPYSAPAAKVDVGSRRTKETGNENYFKTARAHLALGILSLVALAGVIFAFSQGRSAPASQVAPVFILIAVIGALHLAVWQGAKKRMGWARITSIVLGVLSLPGFPVGTIIGVYLIVIAWSKWREPEVYSGSLIEGWPTPPTRAE